MEEPTCCRDYTRNAGYLGLVWLYERFWPNVLFADGFWHLPASQQMADLPLNRISPDEPPFTSVGIDCFGPFEVKCGRSQVKRYGVIFICLALRAVHIKAAASLKTDSFINALQHFITRRKNFVQAMKLTLSVLIRELRSFEQWNQSQINDELLQKGIKWNFNPPSGSHHGGASESLIRSVRKVLYSNCTNSG